MSIGDAANGPARTNPPIGTLGRLHVITDTRPGRDPLALALAALEAGAPVVQVRGKDLTDRELYELSVRLVDACADHGATCIVDDRVHVALAAGAHGVHVGEHDLPVGAARRVVDLAGPGRLVGGTARDGTTARAHARDGADYLGVGPCFTTTTKPGLPAPLGVAGLRAVTEAVDIPVIAIAGVTPARVRELLDAGAYGVAVIGAVSDAPDPRAAVAAFLDALGGPR
jgi:thiamine-phosphate pyrophosphorylase